MGKHGEYDHTVDQRSQTASTLASEAESSVERRRGKIQMSKVQSKEFPSSRKNMMPRTRSPEALRFASDDNADLSHDDAITDQTLEHRSQATSPLASEAESSVERRRVKV